MFSDPKTAAELRRCASPLVGLDRIELSTSALSVLRSNQLSYSPFQVLGAYWRPCSAATEQQRRPQPTISRGSSSSTVSSIPPTTSLIRL